MTATTDVNVCPRCNRVIPWYVIEHYCSQPASGISPDERHAVADLMNDPEIRYTVEMVEVSRRLDEIIALLKRLLGE